MFCVIFYHNHICKHTADYLVYFFIFFCAFSSLLTSLDNFVFSSLSEYIKSCPKFLRFIRTQARISTPTPQSARDFGIDKSDTPTNPTSHPVNRPSYTYFSVPYTGGFTQITDGAQDETEEQTPLIKNWWTLHSKYWNWMHAKCAVVY